MVGDQVLLTHRFKEKIPAPISSSRLMRLKDTDSYDEEGIRWRIWTQRRRVRIFQKIFLWSGNTIQLHPHTLSQERTAPWLLRTCNTTLSQTMRGDISKSREHRILSVFSYQAQSQHSLSRAFPVHPLVDLSPTLPYTPNRWVPCPLTTQLQWTSQKELR